MTEPPAPTVCNMFELTLYPSLERALIDTRRDCDFFRVEPVSRDTNAIDHTAPNNLGAITLQPAQGHRAWMSP